MNETSNGIINRAYENSNETNIVQSQISIDLNSSNEDDIKDIKILWCRNIKRIQMQVNNNLLVH